MTEEKKDVPPQPVAARKTYATPRLRVFGDVAALTKSVGSSGSVADGGHGAMSKTS